MPLGKTQPEAWVPFASSSVALVCAKYFALSTKSRDRCNARLATYLVPSSRYLVRFPRPHAAAATMGGSTQTTPDAQDRTTATKLMSAMKPTRYMGLMGIFHSCLGRNDVRHAPMDLKCPNRSVGVVRAMPLLHSFARAGSTAYPTRASLNFRAQYEALRSPTSC